MTPTSHSKKNTEIHTPRACGCAKWIKLLSNTHFNIASSKAERCSFSLVRRPSLSIVEYWAAGAPLFPRSNTNNQGELRRRRRTHHSQAFLHCFLARVGSPCGCSLSFFASAFCDGKFNGKVLGFRRIHLVQKSGGFCLITLCGVFLLLRQM